MNGNYSNQRGITLVEVLVSMGIFTLVIGSIAAVLMNSFKTRDIVFEQLLTQNEGRRVVQDFTNELRSATASSIGAYPLEKASSTEVVFYTNLDQDTLRERVRYFTQGTILKKGVIKPTGNPLNYETSNEIITEVAHSLAVTTTPVFTYFDQNFIDDVTSAPLVQPVSVSQVRVVGVQIMLDKKPNISPAPFVIQAKAAIRNLKSN